MNAKKFDLKKIFNIDKWQKVQDEMALATKMAIILVDYKGIPVTSHSYCQKFCEYIRSDDNMSRECQKCDSRGGLEAARLNEPYIYLCHCNIVDIAIPIVIEDMYIGALMAGQVLLSMDDYNQSLEIITRPTDYKFNNKENKLEEYYGMLPKLTFNEISLTASMLFNLSKYIIEEAVNKYETISMYESILQNSNDYEAFSVESMKSIKSTMNKNIIKKQLNNIDFFQKNMIKFENSMLKPALEHMINNIGEQTTLKHMANLCHVSASHFSRVFTNEMGEGFSTFNSRLKVEYAKKLLETTDFSILQISKDLGFNDDGYFIKVFKKFENVTPSRYRKYLK